VKQKRQFQIAFLAAAIPLAGCMSFPDSPEHWSQSVPSIPIIMKGAKDESICALDGSYSDAGESALPDNAENSVSLFRMIFPETAIDAQTAITRVSFRGPEDKKLTISAWQHDRLLEVTTLSKLNSGKEVLGSHHSKYFCCHDGLVDVNPQQSAAAAYPVLMFGEASDNFLFRTSDQWLILRRCSVVSSIVVILPWLSAKCRWYRFAPAP
jgi:hypothetical protein